MKISGNGDFIPPFLYKTGQAETLERVEQKRFQQDQAVKVDISEEARELYRKSFMESNPDAEELLTAKERFEGMEKPVMYEMFYFSFSGEDIEKEAENLFECYTKQYDEIVGRYDAGGNEIYVPDKSNEKGYRALTKDEALAKLEEVFNKACDDLVEMEKAHQKAIEAIKKTYAQLSRIKGARCDRLAAALEKESKRKPYKDIEKLPVLMKERAKSFRLSYNKTKD